MLISVLCLVVLAAGTAAAETPRDVRLNTLFDELKQAPDADAAHAIETDIWNLWTVTGQQDKDSLMARGIAAMQSGDFAGALAAFDSLIANAPDFAEAWNKRATVHYLMGHLDASVSDIAKTLTLEPRHFGALSGLGLIYMAIGNDDAAVKAFEKALSIDPHLSGPAKNIEDIRRKQNGSAI